jgi:hypothetical protein
MELAVAHRVSFFLLGSIALKKANLPTLAPASVSSPRVGRIFSRFAPAASKQRRVKRRIRGGSHSGTCEILAVSGAMGTREAGAKGGHARAAKMTAKERSEAAKKAARARWAKAKKRRPK